MQRSQSLQPKTENFIHQISFGQVVQTSYTLQQLQRLSLNHKKNIFYLCGEVSDHVNWNPPYPQELWRPHPWIPGIFASDTGRVFLCDSLLFNKLTNKPYLTSSELVKQFPGHVLKTFLDPKGGRYMYIDTSHPRLVYRLVGECWYFIQRGWSVHHINNNSWDCRIQNLIPVSSLLHTAIHKPKSMDMNKIQRGLTRAENLSALPPEERVAKLEEFLKNNPKASAPRSNFNSHRSLRVREIPSWKYNPNYSKYGFFFVFSSPTSKLPQLIFRNDKELSKWILETYSPSYLKGPKKGTLLTKETIRSLLPNKNFLKKYNLCIRTWLPPQEIYQQLINISLNNIIEQFSNLISFEELKDFPQS